MIDAHVHLHPPRLFAAIRRWFAERSDWELGAQPTEPEAVARVLREAGARRFVFCSYAHRPGMAHAINGWLAETARGLGGYGAALATVHPDDDDPAAIVREALDAGAVGLKIHEDVQAVGLDDPRLAGPLDECARRGAFVLAHVGPIPWDYAPGAGVERVLRVLARWPSLAVVVAHFGMPDTARYARAMAAHPLLHLDTTMAFARSSPMRRDPDGAVVREHADRIVYGTDFPNVPYAYGEEREALGALSLEPAALRAVLGGNAARLLARAERGRAPGA